MPAIAIYSCNTHIHYDGDTQTLCCFARPYVPQHQVRRELAGAGAKWTVLGQSFGGFCLLTYLSTHPEALKAGLFTGGLPPVGRTPDEVIPENQ